jgi:hypothetical protein
LQKCCDEKNLRILKIVSIPFLHAIHQNTNSNVTWDCAPFELVVSAALLGRQNCGGRGSNSISKFHNHNINGGAVDNT